MKIDILVSNPDEPDIFNLRELKNVYSFQQLLNIQSSINISNNFNKIIIKTIIKMARGSAQILDDDEEIDLASFMLEACGLEYSQFMENEIICIGYHSFSFIFSISLTMAVMTVPESSLNLKSAI